MKVLAISKGPTTFSRCRFSPRYGESTTTRRLTRCATGSPARLQIPAQDAILAEYGKPEESDFGPDRGNFEGKFHCSALQHISSESELQTAHVFCETLTSFTDIAHRSEPLMVLTLPGRPLVLYSIARRMIYGNSKNTVAGIGDLGRGSAVETALTRQDFGIPSASRHYRIFLSNFGGLSLALRHEGMCVLRLLKSQGTVSRKIPLLIDL
jgi:hypothetical protein